ncbi:hypothetical protein [Lysinibacillus pakistanensis]|uniref:Phage tail assembly protein n=1 Tax=Lysinibacillus pakistanensis TaxID=759811 RepID=A0AAX3WR38_9BACI|nr:hypothetical protein [Lysinibacillus pakistanensis]MDM5229635.1 hypothetical protein [Lysinibacillus pakistanensis]WHY45247.1 hypothetical protein QNH22_18285 [Lysinibacillus pakistanensis]WHY50256.1 hypothetical protein QNH24_18250 [Lysinibacillus pakistanensis]
MSKKAEIMKDEGVKVELKGRKFEAKFDLNALCELQDKFGDLTKAFEGIDMQDLKKIRALLHIALANGENEGITEKEVGALIDLKNIHQIVDALTTAFNNAMPSTDGEGK